MRVKAAFVFSYLEQHISNRIDKKVSPKTRLLKYNNQLLLRRIKYGHELISKLTKYRCKHCIKKNKRKNYSLNIYFF